MEATKGRKRYWASKNCNKPIEEVYLMDYVDRESLKEGLAQDALYYKELEYTIGLDSHTITYIENKED